MKVGASIALEIQKARELALLAPALIAAGVFHPVRPDQAQIRAGER